MKNIQFLIKPASSLCNMRCRYCFYEDESENRTQHNMGIMTLKTSELLIRRTFDEVTPDGSVSFAFQGGEPTIAGLSYFQHFIRKVKEMNTRRLPVSYTIQTNGLYSDEQGRQWADFLSENHFLAGISLDGEQALHDEYRIDADNAGTWERVSRTIELFKRKGVELNLLCVITRRCAKKAARTYHALKETGIRYLQFIPCLDPLEQPRGSMPYSLSPKDYGKFLCAVFDEWYRDWESGDYTSVRLFEDYVHLAMGLPAGTCSTCGSCGSYFVVEADGSIYPCDFYVLDEWKTGNLWQHSLTELQNSEVMQRFLRESLTHPDACSACEWKFLCNGGCRRDWFSPSVPQTTDQKQNYYCSSFQQFFAYAFPRIKRIAQAEVLARRYSLS